MFRLARDGSLALAIVLASAGLAAAQVPADPVRAARAPVAPLDQGASGGEDQLSPTGLFLRNPAAAIGSVIPFAIASLLAVWIGVERLAVLRRSRVIPQGFVDRFLSLLRSGSLDRGAALVVCEENNSPIAHVFAGGVRKWGRPSVEVEQAIIDGGERQVSHLRKHLRIINGVATVSPLMGLLGTVIGMMMSFFNMAGSDGGNRAEQLAVGIVTALGTTAMGLAIAIPCLILYMYLVGRIDALVMEMDEFSQQVVNRISAEGLAANPPARPVHRARPRATAAERVR